MRILWNNLADVCTLTDSGEQSGFPGANVQHPFLIKQLWTLTAAAQWIKFDAGNGNTLAIDTGAIAQHNISAAASIHLQGNATDVWTAPSVDIVATWSAGIILIDVGSIQTYRFWRFYIDDPTNTTGFLKIGRLGLYPKYQAQEPPERSIISGIVDSTVVTFNPSQQTYSDLGTISRTYTIPMGSVKEATRQSLMSIYAAVGQWKPVIIVPDEAYTSQLPPIYAQQMKVTIYTNTGDGLWLDDGLLFQEVF